MVTETVDNFEEELSPKLLKTILQIFVGLLCILVAIIILNPGIVFNVLTAASGMIMLASSGIIA